MRKKANTDDRKTFSKKSNSIIYLLSLLFLILFLRDKVFFTFCLDFCSCIGTTTRNNNFPPRLRFSDIKK